MVSLGQDKTIAAVTPKPSACVPKRGLSSSRTPFLLGFVPFDSTTKRPWVGIPFNLSCWTPGSNVAIVNRFPNPTPKLCEIHQITMPLLSRGCQSCLFHPHLIQPNRPHPCDQPTPERPRHHLDMWPRPQPFLPSTQRTAAAGSAGVPPITGLSPGRGFRGRAISSLAC
jgi:hypothetical protein